MPFEPYDAYLKVVYHVATIGAYHFEVVYKVPYCAVTIRAPHGTHKRWTIDKRQRDKVMTKLCNETYRLKDYWLVVMGRL